MTYKSKDPEIIKFYEDKAAGKYDGAEGKKAANAFWDKKKAEKIAKYGDKPYQPRTGQKEAF